MCIRGSSRTIDGDYTTGKISSIDVLNEKYRQLINEGADIIEADLGVEAGHAIEKMQDVKSSKRKYFKVAK
jgi:glycerophosphoryl diester phosphodiesterase